LTGNGDQSITQPARRLTLRLTLIELIDAFCHPGLVGAEKS
jgi:hypothetical protein